MSGDQKRDKADKQSRRNQTRWFLSNFKWNCVKYRDDHKFSLRTTMAKTVFMKFYLSSILISGNYSYSVVSYYNIIFR